MIYVLYATKVNIGGWATFTRHLVDSLRHEGHPCEIIKLGNRTELFLRPFGGQDHVYRNMHIDDLVKCAKNSPIIIAALGKHFIAEAEALIKRGAKVVIHDTAESTVRMGITDPWCIRKVLAKLYNGTFIRHPYVRHNLDDVPFPRTKRVVATSRVDFDKNTDMILDANRLGAKIDIVGFENRLYTKFKIMPNYPEWKQSQEREHPYPKTGAESFAMLRESLAMVDLTDIKGDGGGTQYTFLEAWDAGAVPVIGHWWLRKSDDMVVGRNCWTTDSAADLARLVKQLRKESQDNMRKAGEIALKRHAPKVIVPQVLDWLYA